VFFGSITPPEPAKPTFLGGSAIERQRSGDPIQAHAPNVPQNNSPAVVCWAIVKGLYWGCILDTAICCRLTMAPQGAFVLSPETTVSLCGSFRLYPSSSEFSL
jgi:hypothetical protein